MLDVYEKEPLSPDSKLWDLKNILMYPHNADLTHHHQELTYKIFLKNLALYMAGKPLTGVADKKRGY